MRIAAVIPAYNEAAKIGEIVDQTGRYVDEVIVVDDGSTDETAAIARENGALVLQHVINTGVGGALRTGYKYVLKREFDFLVQIDGDGQHDPVYIEDLLEVAQNNDIVLGSRYLNESIDEYPLIRWLGIQFFTFLVNTLGGIEITDVTSGYRVYHVNKLETIMHGSDRHWAVEQTLGAAKAGLDIEEVSVEMPTRDQGESQFSLETFALYPIRMMDVVIRILVFR